MTMAQVVSLSKTNGIRHVRTAPYHPASNGLAERSMRIFKGGMKKLKDRTLEIKLAHFLFSYRLTPQTTTGLSPSELLFGHRLCCHLDFLRPNFPAKLCQCLSRQKILMTIMLATDIYKLETRVLLETMVLEYHGYLESYRVRLVPHAFLWISQMAKEFDVILTK